MDESSILQSEMSKPLNQRIRWDSVDEIITNRFELVQKMGRGNYGTVWKAIDKRDRSRVGIKKINDAFNTLTDAQRSLREITILMELGQHPNILRILDLRRGKNHKDLYLVLEFAETDLLTLIRAEMVNNEQR